MMTYEIFKETVNKRFNDFLPEDIRGEVVIQKVHKTNMVFDGLTIRKEFSPQIYLQPYFQKMEAEQLSLEDVLNEMAAVYIEGVRTVPFTSVKEITKAITLDNVVGKLINADKNTELLENCPHRIIAGDIALVYTVRYSEQARTPVTNSLMKEQLKCSEEDLYSQAVKNSSSVLVESLFSLIKRMMPSDEIPEFENFDEDLCPGFKVLRTEPVNGAVALLNTAVLENIRKSSEAGIIKILPSSIHEILVVTEDFPVEMLKDMVSEVNATEVSEQDFLSDNVLIWDGEKLTVA